MMKQMAGMGMGGRLNAMRGLTQMGLSGASMPKGKKGSTKYNPRRDDKKKRRKRRR